MGAATAVTLPPDEIVVQSGRVTSLKERGLWNLIPTMIIEAQKEPDGRYSVSLCDPEHGGGPTQFGSTMAEAAGRVMHPDIATKMTALFDLQNPTEAQIRKIHYRKKNELKVIFR